MISRLLAIPDQTSARQCSVYPSYPQNQTPTTASNTLIVSYCWTQDAERMGALINRDGTVQPELIDMIFRDLAAVHKVAVGDLQKLYKEGDYYAWDWLHDPLTMGSSSLQVAALALLNACFRWICVLRSRCVRGQ